MRRYAIACATVGMLLSIVVGQNIPPGYEIVPIAEAPDLNLGHAQMNNRGQIVFSVDTTFMGGSSREIFLYDGGRIIQLTNDAVFDGQPDINDDGTIVWTRRCGAPNQDGPTSEIMLYRNGTITRLTNDAYGDGAPRINNLGHVVWDKVLEPYSGQCKTTPTEIFYFDGQSVQQLTHEGLSCQAARINDADEIIWGFSDHCGDPDRWRHEIWLRRNGETIQVSTSGVAARIVASLNNRGQVAWAASTGDGDVTFIWEDGVSRMLTDNGSGPLINDSGDIAYWEFLQKPDSFQAWLYRRGEFFQVTADPSVFWHWADDFNNRGEFVLYSGDLNATRLDYVRRRALGDLNCDGLVDNFDIEPFIGALLDPLRYLAEYPQCDVALADLNGDGTVDFFDIDPFIDCVLNGGCP